MILSLYDQLVLRLNATFPMPPRMQTAVETSAASWKSFCALSPSIKSAFQFNIPEGAIRQGYSERSNVQGRDEKEHYEFSVGHRFYLPRHPVAQTLARNSRDVSDFHTHAQSLLMSCWEVIQWLGQGMKIQCPGIDEVLAKAIPCVRFIHYPAGEGKQLVARAHHDKNLTLHVYENQGGLQLMNFNHEWEDVSPGPDTCLLFPGFGFFQVTAGQCKPVLHRVLRREQDMFEDRFSIVVFICLPDVMDIPYKELVSETPLFY